MIERDKGRRGGIGKIVSINQAGERHIVELWASGIIFQTGRGGLIVKMSVS